ncbi:esterase/lipase family protein [Numidum massiliense]|uniref:esterase/lipase family protein n=1 Tax=Numidum massiliense TaxID=1522315 RepID=UPI0006D54A66|nr:alpha/beta fold hydrolase [Numidum massiliense]
MKKRYFSLVLTLLVLVVLVFPTAVTEAGGLFPKPGKGRPGDIYYGELPDDVDPNKPAVVFVQGLTNDASIWYEGNDMYERARRAGFETAFVELYDSAGTPKSNWTNGEMLAGQLEQISAHFGGKKLVVIGYSKGGVDVQTALVHYGKHPLVSNVVTIGSPHWGTQLADLAYSDWVWWLSELLGSRNEGVYSMQTGVMNAFREQTDSRPEVRRNSYYTLAGESWGKVGSSSWFGGLYLSSWGKSDGVVPVASASLAGGTVLAVGKWDHTAIRQGKNTFNLFRDRLTLAQGATKTAVETSANGGATAAERETAASVEQQTFAVPKGEPRAASDLFVRGGEQHGSAAETFYVENGVRELTVDWLSATKVGAVELVDPNGKVVEAPVRTWLDDDLFHGAYHHVATLKMPLAGKWEIRTRSAVKTAYAFVAQFDSQLSEQLKLHKKADSLRLSLAVDDSRAQKKMKDVQATYNVAFIPEYNNANKAKSKDITPKNGVNLQKGETLNIPLQGAGVYNVTMDVTGTTAEGKPFARTVIQAFYVDDNGKVY